MAWVSYDGSVSAVLWATGITVICSALWHLRKAKIPVSKHMIYWCLIYGLNQFQRFLSIHIYDWNKYDGVGSFLEGWILITEIINMLTLNIPLLLCWILLTGGWKKYNSYSCGDKFAKLILVLSAITYSVIPTVMLIISIIKYWCASDYLEYDDWAIFNYKISKMDTYFRFFYSIEIFLLSLWALVDTWKNVDKLREGGGNLKFYLLVFVLLQAWYAFMVFIQLIYQYHDANGTEKEPNN